jgi:hypothetical protein
MFNYKGNSGTNGLYFDILDKPSKKIKSYQNYWCPPPGIGDLEILLRLFGFLAPKYFYISWLCNLWILSVPDEVYSRNVSCALN